MLNSPILFLLMLSLIVDKIACDCEKTLVVHCENLNDYLKYETDSWRQLSIGNGNYKPNEEWSLLNLWRFLIQDLDKLETLSINNQLHGKLNDEIRVDLKHQKLKYLNFYKNNLTNFYLYMFRDFPSLIELNLINNNIKQIIGQSIRGKVDTLDLSQNQLSEIKSYTFVGQQIRQLIIKSNQLSNIGTNAFNESLEILNLDRNDFTYVPDEGLENLVNLKVLTMSRNRITLIPKLDFLKKIRKLDFSYNQINNIRGNFQRFSELRHIDLSHNRLKTINYISLIPNNQYAKKISIAFNYLTQFELSAEEWQFNFTAPVTLILFGNPWICQCLDEMNDFLKDRPFKRTKCDLSLFGNGRFPSCVHQKLCLSLSVASDQSFYESFLNVLDESKKQFTCNVDDDMLNLERKNRQYGVVGLPVAFRPSGNGSKPIF